MSEEKSPGSLCPCAEFKKRVFQTAPKDILTTEDMKALKPHLRKIQVGKAEDRNFTGAFLCSICGCAYVEACFSSGHCEKNSK